MRGEPSQVKIRTRGTKLSQLGLQYLLRHLREHPVEMATDNALNDLGFTPADDAELCSSHGPRRTASRALFPPQRHDRMATLKPELAQISAQLAGSRRAGGASRGSRALAGCACWC